MPALCIYLQVHQPYRLRTSFSFFDASNREDYFDTDLNRRIMQDVASKCYIPTGKGLIKAIRDLQGCFKLSFSITGTAIEQMREFAPEALSVFKELVDTGCVELLGETYYHSLASLIGNSDEFSSQVDLHVDLMRSEFGIKPEVFRNTELIFSDAMSEAIKRCGFKAAFVEGVPDLLQEKTSHAVCQAKGGGISLFPRNYHLSDLIAFQFGFGGAGGARLTVRDLVKELNKVKEPIVFLGLDYETFGEHHRRSDGISELIEDLGAALLSEGSWRFVTPSEAAREFPAHGELSFPKPRSWGDISRDLSPWLGNAMQRRVFKHLYSEMFIDRSPKELWRKLQTSDHLYYLSNKSSPDGDVHRYFSPFNSPYEAFVAYMNVLRGVAFKLKKCCGT